MIKKAYCMTICLILAIFSCTKEPSDYERIHSFLKNNELKIADYERIMVVSEKGCPKCAISFANFCSDLNQEENTLFILNATGKLIDISKLSKSRSVLFDFESEFRKLNIKGCETPCGIILSEEKIDTVISIEANGITDRLRYLSSSF